MRNRSKTLFVDTSVALGKYRVAKAAKAAKLTTTATMIAPPPAPTPLQVEQCEEEHRPQGPQTPNTMISFCPSFGINERIFWTPPHASLEPAIVPHESPAAIPEGPVWARRAMEIPAIIAQSRQRIDLVVTNQTIAVKKKVNALVKKVKQMAKGSSRKRVVLEDPPAVGTRATYIVDSALIMNPISPLEVHFNDASPHITAHNYLPKNSIRLQKF
ncbi:MAG: hypothetical protein EXX96DRAFT_562598 [Benjaminiella poitrasii]|nr:MAG: hypothetical protein EXX96DRAFT_562598 [Benjaminiella poitrasii]